MSGTTLNGAACGPFCDKCGVEMTTGLMAAFCPLKKECEFWVPELDTFLAMAPLRDNTASGTISKGSK